MKFDIGSSGVCATLRRLPTWRDPQPPLPVRLDPSRGQRPAIERQRPTLTFTGQPRGTQCLVRQLGVSLRRPELKGDGHRRKIFVQPACPPRGHPVTQPGALVSALVPFPRTTLLWVDVGGAGGCSPGDWMDNEWESNPTSQVGWRLEQRR